MIRYTCWRIIPITLILSLFMILPMSTSAQPLGEWDPDRWLDLLAEGDELYNRALDEEDDEAFRDLLRRSLQLKQAALQMLRGAVIRNQVEDVERLWDDANRDLFNLQENVIVLFLELNQCDAAELQLQQALMDPSILPEGGVEHLEMLLPEVQVCREFLAEEIRPPPFDEERFQNYMSMGDRWHQQARAEENPENVESLLIEATTNYGQALELLRNGLQEGRLTDTMGEREAQLYRIYNGIVNILFEANLCSVADRKLRQAIADAQELPGGNPDEFRARQPEVAECEARRLALLEPDYVPECTSDLDCMTPQICVEETCVDPGRVQLQSQGNTKIVAYVLWGVAGAAAVTSVTLWFTGADTRDASDTMNSECASGGADCDINEQYALSNDVNNRKTTVAVLAGGAFVSAVIGTILYFTAEDEPTRYLVPEEAEAGVPVFNINGLGGSVRVNF